jgi:pimeloyl-ACP methyl ester carboxylesterase
MKKIFFKTLILIAIATTAIAQDVPTQWIHGWGKGANFWIHYAPTFAAQRRMNSGRPFYSDNDDNGVVIARATIDSRIARTTGGNILIGHSMGGLVAREYARAVPGNVRGIVTVASPNQGAPVATHVLNGFAQTIINKGVNDMSAGPVEEGKTLLSSLFPLGPGAIAQYYANKRIDAFTIDMFAAVRDMINDQAATRTIQDFAVSGTYIAGLNAVNHTMPVVNIVCEENSKAALRLANGMIFAPENSPLHQYSDNAFVEYADKLREIYKGFRIYHDVQKFAQPWRAGHHNRLANHWHRGENYLESVHEVDYNTLIGTTRLIPTTSTVLVQVCNSTCGGISAGREDCPPPTPADCYYTYQTITTYRSETTLSDGLVPSWAQKMRNITANNVYLAPGVSHAEPSNHPEAFNAYNRVFDRTDALGVPRR